MAFNYVHGVVKNWNINTMQQLQHIILKEIVNAPLCMTN